MIYFVHITTGKVHIIIILIGGMFHKMKTFLCKNIIINLQKYVFRICAGQYYIVGYFDGMI